jgi:hypothetical protein
MFNSFIAQVATIEVLHDSYNFDARIDIGPGPHSKTRAERTTILEVSFGETLIDDHGSPRSLWCSERPDVALCEIVAGNQFSSKGLEKTRSYRM